MNGISEPLPGLLDDPQFQLPDLPALTDFHIAPLRDPAPVRHNNAPLPLEPVTASSINPTRSTRPSTHTDGLPEHKRAPYITPSDVLQARESKKPHLTISEIIEHDDEHNPHPVQLPSFVSLSVVEKSPIQAPSAITGNHVSKRPRLDQENDFSSHDFGRQLPRPAHKELPHSRPAPLLPAMVTGLHEPPPSAALLPPMDPDQRPSVTHTATTKIKVKDILMNDYADQLPSPKLPPLQPTKQSIQSTVETPGLTTPVRQSAREVANDGKEGKEGKARRTRRKWADGETQDLLLGVERYGAGKWKQILEDPSFYFHERTTVDLKDRYRVAAKEKDEKSTPDIFSPAKNVGLHSRRAGPESEASIASAPNDPLPQRRRRRAWTPGEDERLISGMQKHGFQWTNIHDDDELDLAHRRATDLRDRIRNKYPEGYRQAETAPLRSDVKKAEKSRGKKRSNSQTHDSSEDVVTTEKEKEQNSAGFKLPSLTFDDDDDMDWENHRLPPLSSALLDWDDLDRMGV